MDIKKELQDSLVRAEMHVKHIREHTEYDSEIIQAEKDALDAWLRLVGHVLKEEHGIHVEPIVELLIKAAENGKG